MEIYGYEKGKDKLLRLTEVTFNADPGALKDIGNFFIDIAKKMEEYGPEYGHEHYSDWKKRNDLDLDIIVHSTDQEVSD